MNQRLRKLQKSLAEAKLDYFLLDSPANRYYLTGFTGSAGVLLIPSRGPANLYVDSRYTIQAKKQTTSLNIIEFDNFFSAILVQFGRQHHGARIGFETAHITYDKQLKFKKFGQELRWVSTKDLVEDLRLIKDLDEIKQLKKALKIADQAFEEIKRVILPGKTEKEIAFKMEMIMKELGADKSAWEPLIVAAGKNSALPHHGHSNSKLKFGDCIQLDYGCVVNGYHTDTSRVLFLGRPTSKQGEIYDLVYRAQMLGISLVKKDARSGEIDQVVKEFLKNSTHGVYRHGLGHGVGLEIHEAPTLYTGSKELLRAGEVLTIEPGIYLENWGGMRLEDMVLVRAAGGEVLTKASKNLEEIIIK